MKKDIVDKFNFKTFDEISPENEDESKAQLIKVINAFKVRLEMKDGIDADIKSAEIEKINILLNAINNQVSASNHYLLYLSFTIGMSMSNLFPLQPDRMSGLKRKKACENAVARLVKEEAIQLSKDKATLATRLSDEEVKTLTELVHKYIREYIDDVICDINIDSEIRNTLETNFKDGPALSTVNKWINSVIPPRRGRPPKNK